MIFYSLQGLGNSILNFPVLHALRAERPVRVVAFENGSAAFFRAFHDHVVGVRSNLELLKVAARLRDVDCFVCYPTWRRELSAHLLTRAKARYLVRPAGWFGSVFGSIRADHGVHDLENNRRLLARVPNARPIEVASAGLEAAPLGSGCTLGVHATASSVSKYYPRAFWIELLSEVAPRFDAVDFYCGPAADEARYLVDLRASLPESVATRSQIRRGLGFRELAARFVGLTQFIGSDSAPMHLAALLGRPTLALWSFANYRRIHPYGDHCQIYMPAETRVAREFTYPAGPPDYLTRARASDVVAMLDKRAAPDFVIARPSGREIPVKIF